MVIEEGQRIEGALLALADASPVAWVRLAALSRRLEIERWLDHSLPRVADHMAAAGAEKLAWLDYQEWAGRFLEKRGFAPAVRVLTLSKTDRVMPKVDAPHVVLRRPTEDDFVLLAGIDQRAFKPVWWRSEASVRRRASTTSRFIIAETEDGVAGYAEWECAFFEGHINRLAVDPICQRMGIGTRLLQCALEGLWDSGAEIVSLNTQESNRQSQCLYDRFNFRPTGDRVTVWALGLTGRSSIADEPQTALRQGRNQQKPHIAD